MHNLWPRVEQESDMGMSAEILYDPLLFSLEREHEHCRELLGVVAEESDILKESSLPDILEFNAKKERVLLSLKMATEIRIAATEKMASDLDIEKPVSMTQLIACAPNSIRQKLVDSRGMFVGLLHDIERINETNKSLIRLSLSHLGGTLNYINSLAYSNSNYDQSGQMKAGESHGRLISQAG